MIFALSSSPHNFMVLSICIPCLFHLERLFCQFQEFSLFLFFSFFPYNGRAVKLLKNWILKTMRALTTALLVLPPAENSLCWWNSRCLEGDTCHIAYIHCFSAQFLSRYQINTCYLFSYSFTTVARSVPTV